MQESYKMSCEMLPVAAEEPDDLELEEFSTVQYSVAKGRIISAPIDAEHNIVCLGN